MIDKNQENKFILHQHYLNNLCVRNQFAIRLNETIPKRFEIHLKGNYFSPYISTAKSTYAYLLDWLKSVENVFDEIYH